MRKVDETLVLILVLSFSLAVVAFCLLQSPNKVASLLSTNPRSEFSLSRKRVYARPWTGIATDDAIGWKILRHAAPVSSDGMAGRAADEIDASDAAGSAVDAAAVALAAAGRDPLP